MHSIIQSCCVYILSLFEIIQIQNPNPIKTVKIVIALHELNRYIAWQLNQM